MQVLQRQYNVTRKFLRHVLCYVNGKLTRCVNVNHQPHTGVRVHVLISHLKIRGYIRRTAGLNTKQLACSWVQSEKFLLMRHIVTPGKILSEVLLNSPYRLNHGLLHTVYKVQVTVFNSWGSPQWCQNPHRPTSWSPKVSHGINRRRIQKKTAITVPKLGDMQCTRFMETKELDRSNVSYTEERETKSK